MLRLATPILFVFVKAKVLHLMADIWGDKLIFPHYYTTTHYTATRLHSYTLHSSRATQLHSSRATELQSYTVTELHSYTATQLHSTRATQLHS